MNDVTAKSLLIELQCTNKDITEAQNDALSYVISFLDEIVKESDRGAPLSNTIDNGDKIDGYDYIYKTDSEGVPYINIDSVRAMLTKATNVVHKVYIGKKAYQAKDAIIEFEKKMDVIRDSLDHVENYFDIYAETIRQINACMGRCTDIAEIKYYIDRIKKNSEYGSVEK